VCRLMSGALVCARAAPSAERPTLTRRQTRAIDADVRSA